MNFMIFVIQLGNMKTHKLNLQNLNLLNVIRKLSYALRGEESEICDT